MLIRAGALTWLIVAQCLLQCAPRGSGESEGALESKTQQRFEACMTALSGEETDDMGALTLGVAEFFQGSPYVARSLEADDGIEKLTANLEAFDCLTYVESCLAMAQCLRAEEREFSRFLSHLKDLRYRSGRLDGYGSRLHYTLEWIRDAENKGLMRDVTAELGGQLRSKPIDFMSSHPEFYDGLKDPDALATVRAAEQRLSAKPFHVIPVDELNRSTLNLQPGDMIAFTTRVDGLDVAHVGFAAPGPRGWHLLHASSAAQQVVMTPGNLGSYVADLSRIDGIIVARPIQRSTRK